MKASHQCHVLLRHFEQCRLKAYADPYSPLAIALRRALPTTGLSGHPWTIGWGHTGPEVVEGLVWTQEQADAAHVADTERFEREVTQLLAGMEIPQCQFDALVSFAYNVGSDIDLDTKAEGLGDSTLLKMLLAGNPAGAANQFLAWDRAQGVHSWGLAKRRTAERALFLGADVASAIQLGDRVPRF
jgi:lysozyme